MTIIKIKAKGYEIEEQFVDHNDAHCCECGIHIPQYQKPFKGRDGDTHTTPNTFIVASQNAIPSLGWFNKNTDIYCSEECLSVWAKEANEYQEQQQKYLDSIDTSKVPF